MFSKIREWQESGLSQAAFCKQSNVAYGNFHYWYKRFRNVDFPAKSGFAPLQISSIQQRNRGRFNVTLHWEGEDLLLCDLAKKVGISQKLLRTRLAQGMLLQDAVIAWNYCTNKPLNQNQN